MDLLVEGVLSKAAIKQVYCLTDHNAEIKGVFVNKEDAEKERYYLILNDDLVLEILSDSNKTTISHSLRLTFDSLIKKYEISYNQKYMFFQISHGGLHSSRGISPSRGINPLHEISPLRGARFIDFTKQITRSITILMSEDLSKHFVRDILSFEEVKTLVNIFSSPNNHDYYWNIVEMRLSYH
jgi:hypothetical protein